MSFPHEDPIIKAAAPFVNLGLVEYRVSLYTALARFALTRGHQYWGYRFAGWGLHYVQDMNQPYHARLMPGMGTFRLLWMYLTGSQSEIDGAIVLLSNRHLIVEQYLFRLFTSYSGDEGLSPVFPALVGSSRRGPSSDLFRAFEVIDGISRAAYERADALDRLLVEVFPPRYVSDPSYDYGADPNMKDYDPLATLRANDPQGAEELEQYLASIMGDLGLHTRRYLDFVRSDHAVFWTPDHPSWSPYAGAASRQPPSDMRAAVYLASTLIVLLGVVLGLVFLLRRVRGRSA